MAGTYALFLAKKGIKVSKAEMKRLDITSDQFHPEWNYTIRPRQLSTS